MNIFLSYVKLSLEFYVVSTFWLGSDTSGTFYLCFTQPSYELERPALNMHILWCRTDISSCKLSANVSLTLGNPFPVLSLCKLNHSAFLSSKLARKSPANSLFPSGKAMFFWRDSRWLGPFGKFQQNIEIFIKTTRVSRLAFHFSWLW